MESKIASSSKLRKSINTRVSIDNNNNSMPPKGATIIERNVSTSTEEIENGFLITKSVDGRYKIGKSDDSNWFNYSKKWYSKTDPLTVKIDDKSLADAFDEE